MSDQLSLFGDQPKRRKPRKVPECGLPPRTCEHGKLDAGIYGMPDYCLECNHAALDRFMAAWAEAGTAHGLRLDRFGWPR